MGNPLGQGSAVLAGVLATGLRSATPLLFAGLGEMLGQRSGVFNLGIDGIMMIGAYAGFITTMRSGNLYLGVLASLVVGAVMGLLTAVVTVTLRAKQGISGVGIYMLGWGLADFFFRLNCGYVTTVKGFSDIRIPFLSDIPVLGPALFRHNWLVYLSLILVPVTWFLLFRTTWGLSVRAAGESPQAADTLGVSVSAVRYSCLIVGGALAGLAGSFITLGYLNMYAPGLTGGRGFIALALVYFGRWNPGGVLTGALLFGVMSAFQVWLQVLGVQFPYEFVVALPYLMTIIILILIGKKARGPAALGEPFYRNSR